MFTLAQVFRLCDISDEMIYLKTREKGSAEGIWSQAIVERFDMKKIPCTKIALHYDRYDGEFLGYIFTVPILTHADIYEAEDRFHNKKKRRF